MYKEEQNFIYIVLSKENFVYIEKKNNIVLVKKKLYLYAILIKKKQKYTYTEKRILIHENKTKSIYSKNKYFDLKKSRKYIYKMF